MSARRPPTPPSHRVDRLAALTRALLARPADDSAYDLVLEQAIAAVDGAEAGSVAVRGDDGRYRFVAARGFDLAALRGLALEPGEVLTDVSSDGRAVVIVAPERRNTEVMSPDRSEALRVAGEVDRIRASIAVPIVLGGEVVATFRLDALHDAPAEAGAAPSDGGDDAGSGVDLEDDGDLPFGDGARHTAEAFAEQVAWVVSRWRWEAAAAREAQAYRELYTEARRRAHELEVLDRLRQSVARGGDLAEVLELTGAAVAEALGAPMVSVHLVEDGVLRLRHALGYAAVAPTTAIDRGIIGRVASSGRAALVRDVGDDPDFLAPAEHVVSEVAVPLEADGVVLGVLNAESDRHAFGDDDLRLLSAIRDQVGVAVQRARLLADLRASEARFRLLAEHARDLICLHAPDGVYTYASPAARVLTGYEPEELIGRTPFDFVERVDHALLETAIRAPVRRGERSAPVSYRVRAKDGRTVWLETSAEPILGPDGALTGVVTTSRDVTERRSFEERLRRGALYDDLTGLPNRTLLIDRLAQAIERTRRDRGAHYAVLFMDLDRFKTVNDSLGHGVGDTMLRAVGDRLREALRSVDTVARFGGDEFCVLLEGLEVPEEAERTAARLQEVVSQPIHLAGRDLVTSLSIGIVRGGPSYLQPGDLLRDADIAMYRAKQAGRGRQAVFDVRMRAEAVARLQLEQELRHAVSAGELEVAYLPVVRLADRVVVGFEALARWRHPEHGSVPPDVFVPLAEETGLILAIDRFVTREACRAMAGWRAAGCDWVLSVNVSAQHFTVGDVVADVRAALAASGLDPSALRLEITERVLMAHLERASEAMEALREQGTTVQVDDYGTGYSSLAYLQRLPIDAIKIDRSLIDRALLESGDDGARAVIAAIAVVARHLHVDVMAEGIQSEDQVGWLQGLGYRYGQGYHYAPPLSEDEVPGWTPPASLAAL